MRWRLSRVDVRWLVALVALALVLRLIWITYATAEPTDGRFNDSVFYHVIAAHLAEGGGYTSPFTFLPTAHFAPGYPFFLAGLYWLVGPHVTVAEIANVVLGAATVGVLYLLALRLFDSRTARIAATLLVFFPGQILFASVVYSETLFALVFMLGLLMIVAVRDRGAAGGWYWLLAFGVVAGLTALVRGAGLSLLIIGPVYWALSLRDWRLSLKWGAAGIAIAVLVLLPWTVRNYRTLDSPLLITSSTGMNFWTGHHEGASGGDDMPVPHPLDEYGPLTRVGGELAINNAGYRLGMRFAADNLGEEALLVGKRFRALYFDGDLIALNLNEYWGLKPFIAPQVNAVLRPLSNVYYYAVLAVAALALVRWPFRRGQGHLLPVLAIAMLTFGHVVLFFGAPRYHFPMVPLLCILAGWVLAEPALQLARRVSLRAGAASSGWRVFSRPLQPPWRPD